MPNLPFWVRWRRELRRWPAFYRTLLRCRHAAGHFWRRPFRWLCPAVLGFGPPRGWFSITERISAGAVRGRILLEQQPATKPHASTLRKLAGITQETQQRWPIFWSYHHNARLIGPTLLLQDERKRVGVESAYGPDFVEDDPGYQQFRRPSAIRLEGNWTSLVSRFAEGFYHWFMDALPRLALLPDFPDDTQVIVPTIHSGYQRDTLKWLGLEGRVRITSEQHLSIEHYYFSSPTNITGLFDPYAVEFLRRSFRERRDVNYDSPKRFFVHRIGATRGIVNENEVLQFFRKRGWPIVDTQTLSMAEQIQLFAGAEQICALHGAALANLVWCEPACRVLELISGTYMNGVYEGIGEAIGLKYDFLLCKGDAEFKALVHLADLKRRLDA
jgi:capsular polysaccharide biosynthesis protein